MAIKIYLSELLGNKKMTQAELARKTGIRPNTINEIYWEMVDRISLEHIEKICSVLNCVVLRAKCKNVANRMQKIGFKKRHFKRLLNAK